MDDQNSLADEIEQLSGKRPKVRNFKVKMLLLGMQ